jgi:dihydrofolate reductase
MGRKTYESLWKALPNRQMIVVSSTIDKPYYNDDNTIFLDDIKLVNRVANKEIEFMWEWYSVKRDIYCIGWYSLYKYCLDEWLIDTVRLTMLKRDYKGDTYFPMNSLNQSWRNYQIFYEQKGEIPAIERFIWLSAQW